MTKSKDWRKKKMKDLKLLNQAILTNYPHKNQPVRVAVVGNSGIAEHDQRKIDNCDVVIRFNNYATRENIALTKDKFKCDILFSTFDLHSYGSQPKDVIIGIPFPFKAKEIYKKPNKWYPNSRHWMVNPYENMKMCEEMNIDSLGACHPLPSLGLTALWHMKDWEAEFYVCGYSWYYNKQDQTIQRWDLRNKNYPKNWNHNYPKEIEWVIKNLIPKNNFIFSDGCMEAINFAKKFL